MRRAEPRDVEALVRIRHANEVAEHDGDGPDPIPRDPRRYARILQQEFVFVAELDGVVCGYGAVQARGTGWYLTRLFVDPATQGQGLGHALLEQIFTPEMWPRFTCASPDPRALPLYIQAGMAPRWPYLWLRVDPRSVRMTADPELRANVDPDERTYLEWNAPYLCAGFPEWEANRGARYLRVERRNRRIGSAVVCTNAPNSWTDAAVQIGPVIAHTPEDARDAMLCAVQWAAATQTDADRIVLPIPALHPAVPELLAMGAWITWTGTFLSSEVLFDPQLQQFGDD